MSITTREREGADPQPESRSTPGAESTMELRYVATDGLAITRRYLLHWLRQPQLVVFSTVQPVMFVLLFRYVFGGAIGGSGALDGYDYPTYLLPGILVQSVAFGATQAAVGLAEDLKSGVIDRFKSLPMARSAVVVGRTSADLVRGLFVVCLMSLVGFLVGADFPNGLLGLVGAIALVSALGYAIGWVFCFIGLSARSTETAQSAGFVTIFPLVFASSVFVPLQTFPGWLQAFAKWNPVSNVADGARLLVIGEQFEPVTTAPIATSIAWIVAIIAVFVPLAVRAYKRAG